MIRSQMQVRYTTVRQVFIMVDIINDFYIYPKVNSFVVSLCKVPH